MTRVEMAFMDNSLYESNFNLYRSTSSPVEVTSSNQVLEPDASEGTGDVVIADTTADVGETYNYAISASNSSGESGLSNEIQVQADAFAMSDAGSVSETLNVSVSMESGASASSISEGRYIDLAISTKAKGSVVADSAVSTKTETYSRVLASPSVSTLEGLSKEELELTGTHATMPVSAMGMCSIDNRVYESAKTTGMVIPDSSCSIAQESYTSTHAICGVDANGFKIPTGNFRNVRIYLFDNDGEPLTEGEWVQTRGLFPTAGKVLQDSQGMSYCDIWLLDAAYDSIHVVADSGTEGFDYVWYPLYSNSNPLIERSDREASIVFREKTIKKSESGGLKVDNGVNIG